MSPVALQKALIAATVLSLTAAIPANASTFKVSKVSWLGDGLHIEVNTDLPDGAELNVAISDEKTGDNLLSETKYVTVAGGRFVAGGFATDRDDKPFWSGHYWLSVARGTYSLPLAAVLPVTVPGRPKNGPGSSPPPTTQRDDKETDTTPRDSISEVRQSWARDVFRVEGKTTLPDGTWLNVGIVDSDDSLVADEGDVWAQVSGGRFIAEGFTKDGIQPIPAGRYRVSIMDKSSSLTVLKPISVSKRSNLKVTKLRLPNVRAMNVANGSRARDDQPAITNVSEVPEFTRGLSDTLIRHQAVKNTLSQLTSTGALRLKCDEGKTWIDSALWQASNAEEKETVVRAVYESCGSAVDMYDARSAKKLARYSASGFEAY